MAIDRDALNKTPGHREGGDPADEREHFIVCKECGQAIDCRRLGDVLHHEQPGHAPIPVS